MTRVLEKPLSHRIASASFISIIGKFACRGMDIATLAILSRLLTPADFGLTALAMITVTIAEVVTSLPLTAALLRVAEPTRAMLDTAFTLAFLRGLVLASVLSALAFIMALVYHEPRLTTLICALSLAPIFRGLTSPRMIQFIQKMDFRFDAGIEVAGKACAFVLSSVIAFGTHSYWAIASATIATPLIICVLSYLLAPYMPKFGLTEWQLFKNLVGWNTLSTLFTSMNWQADRLLLGYVVPESVLGRYAMASNLSGIPIQAVVLPLGRPLLSAFAARRDTDASALGATYLKSSNALLAVSGPIFLGLGLLASPAVRLVLGPGWDEASPYLQWLALICLITLPVCHIDSLALALDKMRMVAGRTIGEFVIAMPTLFIGSYYFGIPGVIVARSLSALVVLFISMRAARILIGCSVVEQFIVLWRTLVALSGLAIIVLALRPMIDSPSLVVLSLRLTLVSIAGGLGYLSILYILWSMVGKPDGVERIVLDKTKVLFDKIRQTWITR